MSIVLVKMGSLSEDVKELRCLMRVYVERDNFMFLRMIFMCAIGSWKEEILGSL